ncbi:saccharopine dehydrogenase NADP-binding domain-containing protein [Cellulosilyticum ruminicola]|uniref:saccharopine dehydrogenase NADP-binding domain-containing protein n=1 Tax=Cellulosilyticum ruminicola TaxID=425254 RepID=UPI0006D0314C|nr:saccharopine dehydrogenase NADP-binding domain-containing protein [Cellulosilyticum ruminicola]
MIGVLGGYGNIGKEVVKLLIHLGYTDIMIGSRTHHTFEDERDQILNEVIWEELNIKDEESLCTFMRKNEVIINAAGPSSQLSLIVARCAKNMGNHVIDCGFHEEIKNLKQEEMAQSVLYNMGSVPGVSEILPLVFKRDFKEIQSFIHFYGVRGAFTESAAADFIEGVIKHTGNTVSKVLDNTPSMKDILPFFEDVRRMIPYINEDTVKIEEKLNCHLAQWYTVISGENTVAFFKDMLRGYFVDKNKLAVQLSLASELDMMGKKESIKFLIEMNGINQFGEEKHQIYIITAPSQKVLSAAFMVAIYESLKEDCIESGVGSMEKIKEL